MTVRKLNAGDRSQAEVTWREVFEEPRAFTEYYFNERFYPEHSFGAFDGDRLIAMTLGRPTMIRAEGRSLPALLIAGVSTQPAYRGRGLMHDLVSRQIAHAKENGFACCYLHPVSESLYASLGFRNGTDALIVRSDPNRAHDPFEWKENASNRDLLFVYDALLQSHDGMQLRDERELTAVFSDYATEQAQTLAVYSESQPMGYVCYSREGSVFELFALCSSAYEALLDKASKRVGRELKAIVPVDCGVIGERVYSMQYLVFNNAFQLPLKNGFCRLAY